jgi:enamine deaminase RidA (YjgF/YER057c/UK114 family)
MPREVLPVTVVHDTLGMYSHAVWLDSALFVAGQVARDRLNELVGVGDIVAQTRQALANLENILREAGGGLSDVVKLTVYLTRREDLAGYRTVRDSTFTQPLPATTLVFVSGLAHPDYLVEIEAVARIERG